MKCALLVLLILAGCGSPETAICELPKSTDWETPGPCVHRRAYQLAVAPGSAEEVAKAAVAGCAIEMQKLVETVDKDHRDEALQSLSAELEKDALFRVTQARAGKCKPIN